MKKVLLILFILISNFLFGQTESEILPDGIIFPRMNTAQRNTISAVTGQCIYNIDTQSIECVDLGGNWATMATSKISDLDDDTYVTTESTLDQDWVQMNVKGQQALWVGENFLGHLLIQPRSNFGNLTVGGNGTGINLNPSSATNNTLLGQFSGVALSIGTSNTGVGSSCLTFASSGSSNTAMGYKALESLTTSSNNTAIGTNAASSLADLASYNTAIGKSSLELATKAVANVAIGGAMAQSTTNGSGQGPINNIAIGLGAMSTSEGVSNVAIGSNSMEDNEGGSHNTAIGVESLHKLMTGEENTTIGHESLYNNTGDGNTALGNKAGHDNTGNYNVFIGYEAGSTAIGDNQLHIANTSTKSLISGDFSTDEVTIDNIINLTPRSAVPPSPVVGTIYMDDGTCCGGVATLRVWTGAAWHNL